MTTTTTGNDAIADCVSFVFLCFDLFKSLDRMVRHVQKCIAGYAGTGGSGTCSICDAGKYQAAIGAAVCNDCGPGSTSPTGATVATQCSCIANYWGNTGAFKCTACSGNSTSTAGSTLITSCLCNSGYTGMSPYLLLAALLQQ
jgi:hypothetical protein